MAITKPYTFQAGTKARASEVNQDFDILYSEVNRIGTEILNIDIDIQNVAEGKADINGNAGQVFKMANAVDSYDGVNKNFLENAIANIKDYISGLTIVKDTSNTIRVSSGSCYDSTYSTVIISTGNITKRNTTQLANGTYYVYIISDNSGHQVDALITTSSITPPLPTGYSLYRQIGYYTTDSNNKINNIGYYGERSNSNKSIYSIIGSVMPDYSAGITFTLINSTNPSDGFVAPDNGFIYVNAGGVEGSLGYYRVYINGAEVGMTRNFDGGYVSASVNALISKGDIVTYSSGYGENTNGTFFPLKGGN
jgi:hypothetical protein